MWVHTFRPLIIFPLIFWFSSPLSLTYSFWIFILLFYLACVLPLSYRVYISFRILLLKVIWCLKISAGNVKRKKTHLLWGWPTCWKGHLIPVVQRFLRHPPPQWTALLQRRATFAGGIMGLSYPEHLPANSCPSNLCLASSPYYTPSNNKPTRLLIAEPNCEPHL